MTERAHLDRGMGLLAATATNINAMVGIGPFLVIPLMLSTINGPHIVYAWLLGAVLAICDGLVYAQFGAALPGSGGPYLYLREAYQPLGLGRLIGFVYICQITLVAPLSIAGGAVGFADYLQFYWTGMTPLAHALIAASVCTAITALLYRDIASTGRMAIAMLAIVLATVGWVIVGGMFGSSLKLAFSFPADAFIVNRDLLTRVGATTVLAMYSYGGYNQVCSIGEEIKNPAATVPRSILLSIAVVAGMYIAISTAIVGLVPWREAAASRTIAAVFVERSFGDPSIGRGAARLMTGLILFVAAASLFSVVLGYSRVPFAAARNGDFFSVFARVHKTKHVPHISLLAIGAASLPFCFFSLGQLVNWLMQVQILTIFVWQCAGVILLRRYRRDLAQPFTMWAYPVPALIALVMWLYIYATGPTGGVWFSLAFLAGSMALYVVFVKGRQAR